MDNKLVRYPKGNPKPQIEKGQTMSDKILHRKLNKE